MDKTTTIVSIVAAVVIVLVIIGGVIIFNSNKTTPVVTTTPVVVTGTTTTNNTLTAPTGTVPVISTSSAVSVTETTASVNGSVNPSGSNSTYWYEYGTTASLGKNTASQVLDSSFNASFVPVKLTGLTSNTTYFFRVTAENKDGQVFGTTFTFTTLARSTVRLSTAPSSVTKNVTRINTNSATLNGTVNPNLSSTNYWFVYGTDQLLTSTTDSTTPITNIGTGSKSLNESHTLTNLNPNVLYYFKIVAQNSYGVTSGLIESFQTN